MAGGSGVTLNCGGFTGVTAVNFGGHASATRRQLRSSVTAMQAVLRRQAPRGATKPAPKPRRHAARLTGFQQQRTDRRAAFAEDLYAAVVIGTRPAGPAA